jgi:hypothetical protein
VAIKTAARRIVSRIFTRAPVREEIEISREMRAEFISGIWLVS